MDKGSRHVSPRLLLGLLILVIGVTLMIGYYLHGRAAARPPTTRPATSAAAPGQAGAAHTDWIGFHNGGPLLGATGAIAAPPMKVRWTLQITDMEAAETPATAPATSPATGPATAPAYHASGHFEAGPAIVGGVVYIADTAGAVRAIDLATSKSLWTFHSDDGFETTPLVLNGRVFIGDLSGMFFALSTATGQMLWKFDAGGNSIHASANYLDPNRDRIVFATDGADIFCLDAQSGRQIWNAKAGDRVNGMPAVSNGSALVSGCDSQLRAIRGADGTEEFAVDIAAPCPGSTAVAGDNLVLGTDQGRVICISAKTHEQRWLYNGIRESATVFSSPAVADGVVVIGARDQRVYGLDLSTGKELWNFATRGDVDSSPVIAGNRVYVGSKDKKLYVLDLKTGKQLWAFTAGRGIAASPAIADGVLVIADEGGHLFCLE